MRTSPILAAILALTVLALSPGRALAEPNDPAGATEGRKETGETANISVDAPGEAALGQKLTARATLTGAGQPVAKAPITFLMPANWGEEIQSEMVVGTAVTGADGVATLEIEMRRSGPVEVIARFDGDERFKWAESATKVAVNGEYQLYTPSVGIQVPGLGIWVLGAAIATVWSLYLVVGSFVLAIARSPEAAAAGPERGARPVNAARRRFMGRLMVPVGMQAVAIAGGAGLITLIARAPRTHGNLRNYSWASHYHRTPFAMVTSEAEMLEMPPMLEREVSFSQEVLPILRAKAGPHFHVPQNSPAPAGIHLGTYEAIMAGEGLVVPGKPEESKLVSVLLDPAMRMPPSQPPLPEEERQIIISWVAQGAKNS
jgi:hypothetical protein